MKLDMPDEDVDLVIRALEHYYAYTVARKAEDARYRDLSERLKRKPAEKVAAVAEQVRKGPRRKA